MASVALNQPYRPNLTIPKEKIDTLFSKMNKMDTQEIKQFSIVHNVPLNVSDTNGENLIHKAINIENILKKEFHRLNIIKFLIQNDVNPDKPNKENQTPLHLACKMQYADIVKYLIETGVNVNYQDNYGATPFHYALQGQIKL
jgi:ankyrin repeat protein